MIELLKTQLKVQHLDGLFNTENGCSCALSDFIPCDDLMTNCRGGVNIPFINDDGDFMITSTKHALENWPKCPECPECTGNETVEIEKNLTIHSCGVCRDTGKIIRDKKDYELLGSLFYDRSYKRSYNKLLLKAKHKLVANLFKNQ